MSNLGGAQLNGGRILGIKAVAQGGDGVGIQSAQAIEEAIGKLGAGRRAALTS